MSPALLALTATVSFRSDHAETNGGIPSAEHNKPTSRVGSPGAPPVPSKNGATRQKRKHSRDVDDYVSQYSYAPSLLDTIGSGELSSA